MADERTNDNSGGPSSKYGRGVAVVLDSLESARAEMKSAMGGLRTNSPTWKNVINVYSKVGSKEPGNPNLAYDFISSTIDSTATRLTYEDDSPNMFRVCVAAARLRAVQVLASRVVGVKPFEGDDPDYINLK